MVGLHDHLEVAAVVGPQRAPAAQDDAADADVVAGLALVDQVVFDDDIHRARDGANIQLRDLLLNLQLLVVAADLRALRVVDRLERCRVALLRRLARASVEGGVCVCMCVCRVTLGDGDRARANFAGLGKV